MTLFDDVFLITAAALSPRFCRAERREQWSADLRDASELGISRWAVIAGALSTALVSRGRHSNIEIERRREEENMFVTKRDRIRAITHLAGGALGSAALIAVIAVGGLAWADSQLGTALRVAGLGTNANVTVVNPKDQPAPEKADPSTVHVVQITDPATGEIVWQEPK